MLWAGWLLGTQNYPQDQARVRVPEPQAAISETRLAPYLIFWVDSTDKIALCQLTLICV